MPLHKRPYMCPACDGLKSCSACLSPCSVAKEYRKEPLSSKIVLSCRGTRCCKLCRDPEHDVASCPQLDDLAADDRKAAVRAYLSRNRQDAEKLLERLRDGRSTEQEGHKRSTKSSRLADVNSCLSLAASPNRLFAASSVRP